MESENKQIIYIDDNYQAGLLAKVFLERENFKVDICINTLEAREKLKNKQPHLIISDIGLPGENGLQFFEWLQQSQFKEIPFLFVSAHALGFNEVLQKHKDIFIQKPIFFADLVKRIKKIFSIGY